MKIKYYERNTMICLHETVNVPENVSYAEAEAHAKKVIEQMEANGMKNIVWRLEK